MGGPPNKKQKREEHRNEAKAEGELPKKKFYRQRAHANPFSDHALTYPASPSQMDWSSHYPSFVATKSEPKPEPDNVDEVETSRLDRQIEIADIGCGFGGLLFALAPKYPDSLILGLEIRTSVTEYVEQKILAMRAQAKNPNGHSNSVKLEDAEATKPPKLEPDEEVKQPSGDPDAISTAPASELSTLLPSQVPASYTNISVLRANTMKFLPNLFPATSLTKIFLCFPDPHFKTRKHKARIVSPGLVSEYAYVMKPGGVAYTITDVEDLHLWMCSAFRGSGGLFEEVPGDVWEEREGEDGLDGGGKEMGEAWEAEVREDVRIMREETEEGKKVTRNGGQKFVGVWRRVADPPWP
ncbi:tRNA (guanine-N(7)-)-methyltransferase (tRNA(m7G46)-methyltransferase) [Oleoguttula sp. CCFEE 5521]